MDLDMSEPLNPGLRSLSAAATTATHPATRLRTVLPTRPLAPLVAAMLCVCVCQGKRHRCDNIVVCCDGSWCGDAMNTNSNVKIIASAFGATAPTSFTKVSGRTSHNEWIMC
jgi:hypothetical protein